MKELPSLYLPETEADSHEVAVFLEKHGIGYRDRSGASTTEVSDETGIPESKVRARLPILKWTDGTLFKNCTKNGLIDFLHDRGYELEDS